MSSFPGSPHIIKGGIVLINPETAAVERIIRLQYNPDTLPISHEVHLKDSSKGAFIGPVPSLINDVCENCGKLA